MTAVLPLTDKIASVFNKGFVSLLVFLLAYVFTEWRFSAWMPTVFYGDDLHSLIEYQSGNFPDSICELLSHGGGDKFRPVYMGTLGLLLHAFDENIRCYFQAYVILNALNALIVFAIACTLTKNCLLVSGSIAVTVAASRFSLYQVTQVIGILEGLGFTFFLLTVFCLVNSRESSRSKCLLWLTASIAFAILAIHTHERYIGLPLWVLIAICFLPRSCGLAVGQKIMLAILSISVVPFHILYKQHVLKMHVLTGTGGQKIDFNISRISSHAKEALLSMLGFNEGPEYLVGSRALTPESWPAAVFGGAYLLILASMILYYIYDLINRKKEIASDMNRVVGWLVLFPLLAFLLLLPPVFTIRLEQRWLLQPFVLLLFTLGWSGRNYFDTTKFAVPLVVFALVCVFFSDTVIAKHFGKVYMVWSSNFASLVKVDLLERDSIKRGTNILVTNAAHRQWTLLNDRFFDVYNKSPASYKSVESLAAEDSDDEGSDTKYYSEVGGRIVDITSTVKLSKNPNGIRERMAYDFISQFDHGFDVNMASAATPSGRGVFIMPIPVYHGALEALIVLTGFGYKYDKVEVPANTILETGLDMYYPSEYPLKVSIVVKDADSPLERTFIKAIPPKMRQSDIAIDIVGIDLSEFAGKLVSVTFSANTETGHSNLGHWAVFAAPRIIQRRKQPDTAPVSE